MLVRWKQSFFSIGITRNEDLKVPWRASRLLLIHFDDVVVFHFECFRSVVVVDPFAIEEKAKRSDWNPLTFAVTLLQLAHRSGELDFKVNFAVVLSDNFQANVLRGFVSSVFVGAVVTHPSFCRE